MNTPLRNVNKFALNHDKDSYFQKIWNVCSIVSNMNFTAYFQRAAKHLSSTQCWQSWQLYMKQNFPKLIRKQERQSYSHSFDLTLKSSKNFKEFFFVLAINKSKKGDTLLINFRLFLSLQLELCNNATESTCSTSTMETPKQCVKHVRS